MCSNFSKHHSVLDFCLFECNYHPLERLCFILWAAKFLKSGRWTDSSRNKSMYYFTEHSELEGTHKESNSPVNGPHGDQSCALGVAGTVFWPSEPSSSQELGFEPCVLLLHSNFHTPKAPLEAQELGTTIPHCGSAFWPYFEHQKNICCTPGQHEILPCQALHP